MRTKTSSTFSLAALALGFAAALAASPAARAEGGSDGLGSDALVASVGRDSAGWSNGAPSLTAKGDGSYSLSYTGRASGEAGAGQEATVVGNHDGNPVVVYRAPRAATMVAHR